MLGPAVPTLLSLYLIDTACPTPATHPADAAWLVTPGPAARRAIASSTLEPTARRLALADSRLHRRLAHAFADRQGVDLPPERLMPGSGGLAVSIPVARPPVCLADAPGESAIDGRRRRGSPAGLELRGRRHRFDPFRPRHTPGILLAPIVASRFPTSTSRRHAPAGTGRGRECRVTVPEGSRDHYHSNRRVP